MDYSQTSKEKIINDGIRCTVRLMKAGFFITVDCETLETALTDVVWDKEVKDKDERLDDDSSDSDTLDAFEYTIERDMNSLMGGWVMFEFINKIKSRVKKTTQFVRM